MHTSASPHATFNFFFHFGSRQRHTIVVIVVAAVVDVLLLLRCNLLYENISISMYKIFEISSHWSVQIIHCKRAGEWVV